MIVTIAHAKIQPGKRDAFLEAVPPFLSATRAEKGCIVYNIVECTDEPNHFLTVERWDGKASMDAHMAAEHTQVFLGVGRFGVRSADDRGDQRLQHRQGHVTPSPNRFRRADVSLRHTRPPSAW